jgi:protoporphyrinogen oxidase
MQSTRGPIGKLDPKKPIRIYGAGISGLIMAHYLEKHGFTPEIFEKGSRPGGKIYTETLSQGQAETAANAIFTNDDTWELIENLNLTPIHATEKLKKKVYRGSTSKTKPFTFLEMIKILPRLFKRCPLINDEMSVQDFFVPLLGQKLCEETLSSVLSGIYATSADQLNLKSIFNMSESFKGRYINFLLFLIKRKKAESTRKSMSISFKDGMKEFILKLENSLKTKVQYNSSPKIDHSFNNIICTSATEAATLLKNDYPLMSEQLNNITYLPLSTSTYILNKPIKVLSESFGLLFPRNSKVITMGILNNSAIFKRGMDNQYWSYTFITPKVENLESIHTKDLQKISDINLSGVLIDSYHHNWQEGIPLYDHQRLISINKTRSLVYNYPEGLILFGNYVDGIAIRNIISHAKNFARSLSHAK